VKKLLVILFAVGLAGGFGVLSGSVRWLAANLIIAAVLGVVGWLVFVHNKPYRTCRWCKKRKNGKRWPFRRRCWRCKNKRETLRLGAYRVHKVKDSLARAWAERGDGR